MSATKIIVRKVTKLDRKQVMRWSHRLFRAGKGTWSACLRQAWSIVKKDLVTCVSVEPVTFVKLDAKSVAEFYNRDSKALRRAKLTD